MRSPAQFRATGCRHHEVREVMEIGPPIAEGRTAEVFDLGPDRVLKLMRPGIDPVVGELETRAATTIAAAGLAAPRLLETVDVDGRLGLVYERVDGPTMLAAIQANPIRIISSAREFARLHVAMHATSAEGRGLPDLKTSAARMLESPLVPADVRRHALDRLERLPDGNSILHYDFHPGNIVMTAAGPRVIDWMTIQRGDPAADVTRTLFLMRSAAAPPGMSRLSRVALTALRRIFVAEYLRSYRRRVALDPASVRAWRPVVLAARVAEGIEAEREWLLAQLAATEQ